MNARAAEQVREIRGVLIPLAGDQLLLPNALVAEVVNYQTPHPIAGAPAWLKGNIGWRGEIVPLVSMEGLMQIPEGTAGHRARIVICNGLGGNPHLAYVGLIAQSIPRLVRVTADNLEPGPRANFQIPGCLAVARIAGETASIPDIDALEQALMGQLPG